MHYFNDFSLWGKYILFAMLKKMIKNPGNLEEAAHRFGCHPDDISKLDRFWDRSSYADILYHGYIRRDEDQGWQISQDPNSPASRWHAVRLSKNETTGYERLTRVMASHPEAVSGMKFRMGLYQEALDPDIVWSEEKVLVGGETPGVSFIVEEGIWKLLDLTEDLWVQRALLRDLLWMNPAHASAIRQFLTDPLFADSILSFLGFAAGSRQQLLGVDYDLMDRIREFNANAIKMGCRSVPEDEIINILDIVEETIWVGQNSVPETFPGLQSFFTTWSALNRCSVWNPGAAFPDVLPLIPDRISLYREGFVWCTTYDEQVVLALEILDRISRGYRCRRYAKVLIALVTHSEPLPPDLVKVILDYLFHRDPDRLVYEKYTYLSLMGSKNMKEAVRMYVHSLLTN